MEQLVCPLCGQAVTKRLYDKITGIWAEKQRIESKYKEKIGVLQGEKKKLKDLYLRREKGLREKAKLQSLAQVKRRTQFLTDKIKKLNTQKDAIIERAEQKIHSAIHNIELKEKRKHEKEIAQIKRQLNKSAQAELKLKLKQRDLRQKLIFKQKETNFAQISAKKIGKYQKERERAIQRAVSLTKTTIEQHKKIKDLEIQLKKQTTPQVEGLLYEHNLLDALKKEFPEDKFQHTGKGGDIIQTVFSKDTGVGIIVYECKRVLKFSKSHIAQAAKARSQRSADFAILVTNATKKGYSGFTIEKEVIVIHPAGVLSLTKLLRDRLIQIANLNLSKDQRNKVVQDIIEYMESAQFKNSLENIIQIVKDEWEDLKKEIQEHYKRWMRKKDAYANIYTEVIAVKQKTLEPITGEKSKSELPQKKFILSLPELKEE